MALDTFELNKTLLVIFNELTKWDVNTPDYNSLLQKCLREMDANTLSNADGKTVEFVSGILGLALKDPDAIGFDGRGECLERADDVMGIFDKCAEVQDKELVRQARIKLVFDGQKVTIRDDIILSEQLENRDEALEWLSALEQKPNDIDDGEYLGARILIEALKKRYIGLEVGDKNLIEDSLDKFLRTPGPEAINFAFAMQIAREAFVCGLFDQADARRWRNVFHSSCKDFDSVFLYEYEESLIRARILTVEELLQTLTHPEMDQDYSYDLAILARMEGYNFDTPESLRQYEAEKVTTLIQQDYILR